MNQHLLKLLDNMVADVTDAYQPEGSINVSQTGQILYDYQSNQNGTPLQ